jgi:hypothetical protein
VKPRLLCAAALGVLLSCGGPPADPQARDLAPLIIPSVNAPGPSTASMAPLDPLREAMDLLKQWRAEPGRKDVRNRVAEAFLGLARAAAEKGDQEKARGYFKIAAEADPGNAEAARALAGAGTPPTTAGLHVEVTVDEIPDTGGMHVGTYHFSVKISGPALARTGDAVVIVLEDAYVKVCGAMGVNPDGKIPVVLYTDREFHDTTGLPPWVGGAYNGTLHLPMAGANIQNPLVKKVIVHEFVHAFNFQVSGGACPTWLDEGLAQYFEAPRPAVDASFLLRVSASGNLPDLSSPSFLIGTRETTASLYQMSLAAVLYLEKRASLSAISAFLQKLAGASDPREAFQETFLFPYAELQSAVLKQMEKGAR